MDRGSEGRHCVKATYAEVLRLILFRPAKGIAVIEAVLALLFVAFCVKVCAARKKKKNKIGAKTATSLVEANGGGVHDDSDAANGCIRSAAGVNEIWTTTRDAERTRIADEVDASPPRYGNNNPFDEEEDDSEMANGNPFIDDSQIPRMIDPGRRLAWTENGPVPYIHPDVLLSTNSERSQLENLLKNNQIGYVIERTIILPIAHGNAVPGRVFPDRIDTYSGPVVERISRD